MVALAFGIRIEFGTRWVGRSSHCEVVEVSIVASADGTVAAGGDLHGIVGDVGCGLDGGRAAGGIEDVEGGSGGIFREPVGDCDVAADGIH